MIHDGFLNALCEQQFWGGGNRGVLGDIMYYVFDGERRILAWVLIIIMGRHRAITAPTASIMEGWFY